MDKDERIWILVARSLSNEASPQEQEELRVLLEQNPENLDQYLHLKEIWHAKSGASEPRPGSSKSNFNSILQKANKQRNQLSDENLPENEKRGRDKNLNNWKYLSVAAILVITFIAFFIVNNRKEPKQQEQVISAQNGSRLRALLPDGTTVWLNSGSKLFYDLDFNGPAREVRLEGEAFFDVKKQAGRPFIVHTSSIDIKVLGTAFNVKSYEYEKNIETTLLHGSIEVIPHADNKTIPNHVLLHPNQKLVVEKRKETSAGGKTITKPSQLKTSPFRIEKLTEPVRESERLETAWLYNRIVFKGETFEELALKLERWYNVHIVFEDEEVKQLKFNGSFEEETVLQAFEALQKVASFTFNLKDHEIFIKSPK